MAHKIMLRSILSITGTFVICESVDDWEGFGQNEYKERYRKTSRLMFRQAQSMLAEYIRVSSNVQKDMKLHLEREICENKVKSKSWFTTFDTKSTEVADEEVDPNKRKKIEEKWNDLLGNLFPANYKIPEDNDVLNKTSPKHIQEKEDAQKHEDFTLDSNPDFESKLLEIFSMLDEDESSDPKDIVPRFQELFRTITLAQEKEYFTYHTPTQNISSKEKKTETLTATANMTHPMLVILDTLHERNQKLKQLGDNFLTNFDLLDQELSSKYMDRMLPEEAYQEEVGKSIIKIVSVSVFLQALKFLPIFADMQTYNTHGEATHGPGTTGPRSGMNMSGIKQYLDAQFAGTTSTISLLNNTPTTQPISTTAPPPPPSPTSSVGSLLSSTPKQPVPTNTNVFQFFKPSFPPIQTTLPQMNFPRQKIPFIQDMIERFRPYSRYARGLLTIALLTGPIWQLLTAGFLTEKFMENKLAFQPYTKALLAYLHTDSLEEMNELLDQYQVFQDVEVLKTRFLFPTMDLTIERPENPVGETDTIPKKHPSTFADSIRSLESIKQIQVEKLFPEKRVKQMKEIQDILEKTVPTFPTRWLGTTAQDLYTIERVLIHHFLHPITELIIMYPILFRTLLTFDKGSRLAKHAVATLLYLLFHKEHTDIQHIFNRFGIVEQYLFDIQHIVTMQLLFAVSNLAIIPVLFHLAGPFMTFLTEFSLQMTDAYTNAASQKHQFVFETSFYKNLLFPIMMSIGQFKYQLFQFQVQEVKRQYPEAFPEYDRQEDVAQRWDMKKIFFEFDEKIKKNMLIQQEQQQQKTGQQLNGSSAGNNTRNSNNNPTSKGTNTNTNSASKTPPRPINPYPLQGGFNAFLSPMFDNPFRPFIQKIANQVFPLWKVQDYLLVRENVANESSLRPRKHVVEFSETMRQFFTTDHFADASNRKMSTKSILNYVFLLEHYQKQQILGYSAPLDNTKAYQDRVKNMPTEKAGNKRLQQSSPVDRANWKSLYEGRESFFGINDAWLKYLFAYFPVNMSPVTDAKTPSSKNLPLISNNYITIENVTEDNEEGEQNDHVEIVNTETSKETIVDTKTIQKGMNREEVTFAQHRQSTIQMYNSMRQFYSYHKSTEMLSKVTSVVKFQLYYHVVNALYPAGMSTASQWNEFVTYTLYVMHETPYTPSAIHTYNAYLQWKYQDDEESETPGITKHIPEQSLFPTLVFNLPNLQAFMMFYETIPTSTAHISTPTASPTTSATSPKTSAEHTVTTSPFPYTFTDEDWLNIIQDYYEHVIQADLFTIHYYERQYLFPYFDQKLAGRNIYPMDSAMYFADFMNCLRKQREISLVSMLLEDYGMYNDYYDSLLAKYTLTNPESVSLKQSWFDFFAKVPYYIHLNKTIQENYLSPEEILQRKETEKAAKKAAKTKLITDGQPAERGVGNEDKKKEGETSKAAVTIPFSSAVFHKGNKFFEIYLQNNKSYQHYVQQQLKNTQPPPPPVMNGSQQHQSHQKNNIAHTSRKPLSPPDMTKKGSTNAVVPSATDDEVLMDAEDSEEEGKKTKKSDTDGDDKK